MTKIGLFDSGVGGLTVLKEFLSLLPDASYIYFGDTARVPYGGKSSETILRYSFENVNLIIQHDIDLLVVACNSATAIAVPRLQKCYNIPIIGVIEPACEKAKSVTCSKRIGVIGTKATIGSNSYKEALLRQIPDAEIFGVACPLFVPIVEEKLFKPELLEPIVRHYLQPLKKKRVDTLVLGCTHYPPLTDFIQKEMGDAVQIVNPARTCAEQVLELLQQQKPKAKDEPNIQFLVTDDPKGFKAFGEAFLQMRMKNVQKISHF